VFGVISVYFNIRNTLPKSGTFLLGHPVYVLCNIVISSLVHHVRPDYGLIEKGRNVLSIFRHLNKVLLCFDFTHLYQFDIE